MPLYALHAKDRPDALKLRLEIYADHRAYVEEKEEEGIAIVLSGPLQSDDGEEMTGSLFILDAPDREAVERFIAEDPFTRHGIWGDVQVTRFLRRK